MNPSSGGQIQVQRPNGLIGEAGAGYLEQPAPAAMVFQGERMIKLTATWFTHGRLRAARKIGPGCWSYRLRREDFRLW